MKENATGELLAGIAAGRLEEVEARMVARKIPEPKAGILAKTHNPAVAGSYPTRTT